MADLNILQVVGYKNSGKTTLISSWTELLSKRNLTAAVIKHHGHGGALEQPNSETDSMRFMTAGAVSSLAYGASMIQLHMQNQSPELSDLVEMAKLSKPDVIFIEGFKEADYPKIVLVREAEDWETLGKLSNIVGVIVHDGVQLGGVSAISQHQENKVNELLEMWLRIK